MSAFSLAWDQSRCLPHLMIMSSEMVLCAFATDQGQDFQLFGKRFSGLRVHVGTTFIAIVIAFLVAIFLLEDVVIVEEDDEEKDTEDTSTTNLCVRGQPCNDHRVLDGREAVTFLKTIKELIEDPRKMLLLE